MKLEQVEDQNRNTDENIVKGNWRKECYESEEDDTDKNDPPIWKDGIYIDDARTEEEFPLEYIIKLKQKKRTLVEKIYNRLLKKI